MDRHLQGYGFGDGEPCDLIYRTAVPRLLDLWAELGVPGVLFVIARDAPAQRDLLRRAVAAGHEVASHSLTHPQPFRTLSDAALRRELSESKQRLEDVTGQAVEGFRAPAWDIDDRVLRMVHEAGYRYDASSFPSPVLLASRLAAYRRSEGMGAIFEMGTLAQAFKPTRPHALGLLGPQDPRTARPQDHINGSHPFLEFPIAVSPWWRVPVYHTMTYLAPRVLRRALGRLLRSAAPVCYEFHAADLLDLHADGVDERMARHPGMGEPVDRKRDALCDVLKEIAAARQVSTYGAACARVLREDDATPQVRRDDRHTDQVM